MKGSGSSKKIYEYVEGGETPSEEKIPSIPVLWLRIRASERTAVTPTLVDTGFDGGIYSDDRLPAIFRGQSPTSTMELRQAGGTIKCEVFRSKVDVVEKGGSGKPIKLGDVSVHIPLRVGELSENIIVGREILNRLNIYLRDENRIEVER